MSAISESIRCAALAWPLGFVGDVESAVLNWAFQSIMEDTVQTLIMRGDHEHAVFYMLFVAAALE